MQCGERLTAAVTEGIFRDELAPLGGTEFDTILQEDCLYARCALPRPLEVAPGDSVRGGVALRFFYDELNVRPYVLRKVCSNGAVIARSLAAWQVLDLAVRDPDEVVVELREAIRSCAAPEAIAEAGARMRSARAVAFSGEDMIIMRMEMRRLFGGFELGILGAIRARMREGGDSSRFGVMNAVTSLARDMKDSQMRWRLEVLGGAIAMLPPRPAGPTRRRRAFSVELQGTR